MARSYPHRTKAQGCSWMPQEAHQLQSKRYMKKNLLTTDHSSRFILRESSNRNLLRDVLRLRINKEETSQTWQAYLSLSTACTIRMWLLRLILILNPWPQIGQSVGIVKGHSLARCWYMVREPPGTRALQPGHRRGLKMRRLRMRELKAKLIFWIIQNIGA